MVEMNAPSLFGRWSVVPTSQEQRLAVRVARSRSTFGLVKTYVNHTSKLVVWNVATKACGALTRKMCLSWMGLKLLLLAITMSTDHPRYAQVQPHGNPQASWPSSLHALLFFSSSAQVEKAPWLRPLKLQNGRCVGRDSRGAQSASRSSLAAPHFRDA